MAETWLRRSTAGANNLAAGPSSTTISADQKRQLEKQTFASRHALALEWGDAARSDWTPLVLSSVCNACGVPTVACPHRLFQPAVVAIPETASVLRLSRPALAVVGAGEPVSATASRSFSRSFSRSMSAMSASPSEANMARDANARALEAAVTPARRPLWRHFYERGLRPPKRPRTLTVEAATAVIDRAYRWKVDRELSEFSLMAPISAADALFGYLADAYVLEPTVEYVAHGLLTAVEEFHFQSTAVELFWRLVSGTAMITAWSYVNTVRAYLAVVDWEVAGTEAMPVADVVRKIYPFLDDEGVADIVSEFGLDFRVSKASVEDAVLSMVLTWTEPRYEVSLDVLRAFDVLDHGWLAESEFVDCMLTRFPEQFCVLATRHFAVAAEGAAVEGQAPLRRLAEVVAFMEAYAVYVRRFRRDLAVDMGFEVVG